MRKKGKELRRIIVVVDLLVVGIEKIVIGRRGMLKEIGKRKLGRMRWLVNGMKKINGKLGKGMGIRIDIIGVLKLKRGIEGWDRIINGIIVIGRKIVEILGKRILGRMEKDLGMIIGLEDIKKIIVGIGIGLGVIENILDVGIDKEERRMNEDMVIIEGKIIIGRKVEDEVGVDVEGKLDMRKKERWGRNEKEVEM